MSQQGRLENPETALDTLTGNTGGPVAPNDLGNINIFGAAPYTVTGNPGTFTLTITDDGTVAYTYTADSGSATPAANNLNILGDATQGSVTSGAGSTITITNSDATTTQKGVLETSTDAESIAGAATDVSVVPSSLAAKLGAQTADGIAYGTGTSAAIGWTAGLTDGQIAIGSTAGVPAAANITSTGGTVTITNGANSINLETRGLTWNVETGTSATMAVDNGYIGNNAAGVDFSLPATSAVGSIFRVTGLQASWTISQNAGQTIYFGTSATTTGAGGSLISTEDRDAIELVCVVADTDFQVLSSTGNITVN